jgi:hypothetical protein
MSDSIDYCVLPESLTIPQIRTQYSAASNAALVVSDFFTLNVTNAPTNINDVYTGTITLYITHSHDVPKLPSVHVTYAGLIPYDRILADFI